MIMRVPNVGDMLLDKHNILGMTISVEYIYKQSFYLTEIEWYYGDGIVSDIYHIGPQETGKGYDILFIAQQMYNKWYSDYQKAKKKYGKR